MTTSRKRAAKTPPPIYVVSGGVGASGEQLVQTMYGWGAVNCELHFAQSRGTWTPPTGIVMPTFMPETG